MTCKKNKPPVQLSPVWHTYTRTYIWTSETSEEPSVDLGRRQVFRTEDTGEGRSERNSSEVGEIHFIQK